MIDNIEINIKSGIKDIFNVLISYKDKMCYINNKKIILSDDLLDRIKRIFIYWKNEYGTSNVIDAQEFTILVKTPNEVTKFHGKGIYPQNYRELIDILGDIYDR